MTDNNKTNVPHDLLLTDRQVSNLCKSFANNLPTDIKLSKTQLSKMIQSGGIMDKTTCPLNNVKKNKHKFYDMTNFFC